MNQSINLNRNKLIPVHIPNLPTAAVRFVIAAEGVVGLNESLKKLSINVLSCQKNLLLENSLACHADMLVYHLGDNKILLSREQMFLQDKLSHLDYKVNSISSRIMSPYPSDVFLNAARVGKWLICNIKTTAPEILSAADEMSLEIIAVKQGYTKCSICVINENTIITDDNSIYNASKAKGIDVLLIRKGSIKLKGHEYGFIGGCTGLIDKTKLAFCGDYKKHDDCRSIDKFLDKHGIEPVVLLEGELHDIGGILPILQENELID